MADLEGTGKSHLIIPVNYYFDPEDYVNRQVTEEMKAYVASGLCVFPLGENQQPYLIPLELTSMKQTHSGFIYSSPTLLDVDGDGKLEILIGTGTGNVYLLDSKRNLMPGFPIQVDPIFSTITFEKIQDKLIIFLHDSGGGIIAIDTKGKTIWETEINGYSHNSPAIGDVRPIF